MVKWWQVWVSDTLVSPVLLASRSLLQKHNMLLGDLWKLCCQPRFKLSLSKWKGVGWKEGFLTDFADQKKLVCTCAFKWGKIESVGKKKKSLVKKFRASTWSAAAPCPYDTKSLIFKMRYLLVLEPNSHANNESNPKFTQWEIFRILTFMNRYYGKINDIVMVKQLPRIWRNSVLSAVVCCWHFWS